GARGDRRLAVGGPSAVAASESSVGHGAEVGAIALRPLAAAGTDAPASRPRGSDAPDVRGTSLDRCDTVRGKRPETEGGATDSGPGTVSRAQRSDLRDGGRPARRL